MVSAWSVARAARASRTARGRTCRSRWARCPRRSRGGYLCASAAVVDLIRNRARTVIYSTGLPPAVIAGAIAALDLIEREPDYAALPLAKAKTFARRAGAARAGSPIVPVLLGEAEAALAASRLLQDHGFLVVAIRPPTMPAGRRACGSPSLRSIPTPRSNGSPTSSARSRAGDGPCGWLRCSSRRRGRYRQDLRQVPG